MQVSIVVCGGAAAAAAAELLLLFSLVSTTPQVVVQAFSTSSAATTTSSSVLSSSLSSSSSPSSPTKEVSVANGSLKAEEATSDDNEKSSSSPLRETKTGTLRVCGPDQKGIVAAFSQLLYGHGCGIIDSEQATDTVTNLFFQRLHFDWTTMHTDKHTMQFGVDEVCDRFCMNQQLNWGERKKQIAIMVSKYDHCLYELLLRHKAGELDCDIAVIISNHPDLEPVAQTFGIPFHVFPITKDTKREQEERELDLLQNTYHVDLVILARYMQIISDDFCRAFPRKVINIHHSFLPAFVGGKPYHRAHERGVKLIGATAHYATAELDEGPIIEQDITRISHRDSVNDLLRKGRILEKNTLVTAVKAHLEDRIIVYNNKCVVFGY